MHILKYVWANVAFERWRSVHVFAEQAMLSQARTHCVIRSFGWWRIGPRACFARTGKWHKWRYALGNEALEDFVNSSGSGAGAAMDWPPPISAKLQYKGA